MPPKPTLRGLLARLLAKLVEGLALLRRDFFRDIRPLLEWFVGGALAILLAEAALNLQWIASNITGWILIIIILAVCLGLYLIRHFFRLAYGMLEIIIGFFVIVGAMSRATEFGNDVGQPMVQLAAGMYVIIRGFDNFAQSEPFVNAGPMFRETWRLTWGTVKAGWRLVKALWILHIRKKN